MTNKATEKQVDAILDGLTGPLRVGECYNIRATYHWTGRFVGIWGNFILLEDASWIANSGRFADYISGKIEPDEVEPCDTCMVNMYDITDIQPWKNKLPRTQK